MKKTVLSAFLLAAAFFAAGAQTRSIDLAGLIDDPQLSREEVDGLLLMREEEKLARDVYSRLADVWNLRVFENIAQSEQTHMDRMADLLAAYRLDDPIGGQALPGEFTNPALAELYGELISRGERSPEDALEVGRDIEVLDIGDLESLMAETDERAVLLVYDNLLRGSRNHLNAFERQLSRY